MRVITILSITVLLAGCAMTEEQKDNFRRGMDALAATAAQQQQRNAAMPPMQLPRTVYCESRRVGNQVETVCR